MQWLQDIFNELALKSEFFGWDTNNLSFETTTNLNELKIINHNFNSELEFIVTIKKPKGDLEVKIDNQKEMFPSLAHAMHRIYLLT